MTGSIAALFRCFFICAFVMFLSGFGTQIFAVLYSDLPLYPLSTKTSFGSVPFNLSYCSNASGIVLESCSVSVKFNAPNIIPVLWSTIMDALLPNSNFLWSLPLL